MLMIAKVLFFKRLLINFICHFCEFSEKMVRINLKTPKHKFIFSKWRPTLNFLNKYFLSSLICFYGEAFEPITIQYLQSECSR